jgi:hypothetical protein
MFITQLLLIFSRLCTICCVSSYFSAGGGISVDYFASVQTVYLHDLQFMKYFALFIELHLFTEFLHIVVFETNCV